jgi:hypothetical protein
MMRVIFLDIDGVLNCAGTKNPRKFPYVVDQGPLSIFQRLKQRTRALVVLSSTWRCDPVGVLAAKHYGVPFDELCPDNPDCRRGEEIHEWLQAHPDVTRFAVIDDDCDGLDGLPLFQPSAQTGLTQQEADAVVEYLEGRSDRTTKQPRIVRLYQNATSLLQLSKS